jgi:predicted nuclease of predicted toxin-antitoxin system
MSESRLFASLYIDEDVTSRLAPALRQRGFEAVAAHEAGLKADDDELHLAHVAEHRMILLTSNRDDFIRLAQKWAAEKRQHHGIVISSQFSERQFGELLRLILNLLNRVIADNLVNTVCFLTAYR